MCTVHDPEEHICSNEWFLRKSQSLIWERASLNKASLLFTHPFTDDDYDQVIDRESYNSYTGDDYRTAFHAHE